MIWKERCAEREQPEQMQQRDRYKNKKESVSKVELILTMLTRY